MKPNACVVLPLPLDPETLRSGGVEVLNLGAEELRFRIPSGGKYGSRLRLAGKAHVVHPSLAGGDLHLLTIAQGNQLYQVRRDLELDLPLNFDNIQKGSTKRLDFGTKSVDVKIPSIAKAGKRLRLRGLAEHRNGGFPGDVYLRLVEERRRGVRRLGFFSNFGCLSEKRVLVSFGLPYFVRVDFQYVFECSNASVQVNV